MAANLRIVPFTLLMLLVVSEMADSDKDKEECTQELVGLATCLPYVGGDAKAPTLDCCSGLKQVLKTNKKCLCVIIKDRNDTGLQINVTLALTLPSVCQTPASVSQCPALLHLDPNSAEAKVFYQLGNEPVPDGDSPAPSPHEEGSGSSSRTGIGPEKGAGGRCRGPRGHQWLGLESVAFFGLLLLSLMGPYSFYTI